MARGISYRDAVLLLGGRGSRTVAALDRLFGGALLAATVTPAAGLALTLFDAKGELTRLSGDVVAGVGDRIRGLSRFDRTERIAAAHAVVVVAAFFEAMRGREKADRWRFTVTEQLKLAGVGGAASTGPAGLAQAVLGAAVPMPTPQTSPEQVRDELRGFYTRLSERVADFIAGLAEWEALDEGRRAEVVAGLRASPDEALGRYRSMLADLERECPEVALWLGRVEREAGRHELARVRTGLVNLASALEPFAYARPPEGVAAVLGRARGLDLDNPILSSGDVPEGLVIPTLEQGYVGPSFRAADATGAVDLITEDWWSAHPVREDLGAFLAGHLVSPQATRAPLLILGQPGSGKSVLTRVVSARLPSSDFLVLRVVLRDVPADADLQTQIEVAIRDSTGERITWPELARSAGDALCVVLLDGFDELLQATAVGQSDYLERVARFQEREAELGRPVAVAVTSRLAVADRARTTPGTVAVRLEPFARVHVERWVEVWNGLNGETLAARGLKPLPVEAVLAYPDLAGQPLLLVMLALYDFDANALQSGPVGLRRAELYERLLDRFARREVSRSAAGLDDREVDRLVEHELEQLALVAFAMFNRGRQWATAEEVDADVTALDPEATEPHSGRAGAGRRTIGRFFFVHESRALRDDRQLRTFEFLHATFAEYLNGWLVAREAGYLVEDARAAAARGRAAPTDAPLLRALLSYAPLAQRATAVSFLHEILADLPQEQRGLLQRAAVALFRASLWPAADRAYAGYVPAPVSVPSRHAMWSFNLVLLAALCGDVHARDLFPERASTLNYAWRDIALLWRSQLRSNGFNGVLSSLQVRREWHGDEQDVRIGYAAEGSVAEAVDPFWTYGIPPGDRRPGQSWQRHELNDIELHAHFVADRRVDALAHALAPLLQLDPRLVIRFTEKDGSSFSGAHALLRLLLASVAGRSEPELTAAYEAFLPFAGLAPEILDRLFVRDAGRLPPEFVRGLADRLGHR